MKNKFVIFAFSLVFCFSVFSEEIIFSAERMNGTAGSSSSKTILEGKAHVKTESLEITADRIELSGKDFKDILSEGNVKGSISESGMDFTCGRLTYNRETKEAILENDVNLEDVQNQVKASAQRIEYNQTSEIAVMQIKVKLNQKENVCTSSYAVYNKKAQLLEMSGNPKIVQGADTFRAQNINLNLDTQEITLDGRVKGSITTSAEKSGGSKSSEASQLSDSSKKSDEEQPLSEPVNTSATQESDSQPTGESSEQESKSQENNQKVQEEKSKDE